MKYDNLPSDDLAIDKRLHDNLRNRRNDAVTRGRAWADHRRERFTDRGLEGLHGPAAVYHFDDVARGLLTAARTLDTPDVALATTVRAYGDRYFRALTALEEALIEARIPAAQLMRFRDQRDAFGAGFAPMLQAADTLKMSSQARPVMAETVRMFIQEMHSVCGWLEVTKERGRVPLLEVALQDALDLLDAPHEPRKRKGRCGMYYI